LSSTHRQCAARLRKPFQKLIQAVVYEAAVTHEVRGYEGQRGGVRVAGGTCAWGRDAVGATFLPTGVSVASGSSSLLALTLRYNPSPTNNRNIINQTISAPTLPQTLTQNYQYDQVNRITGIIETAETVADCSQTVAIGCKAPRKRRFVARPVIRAPAIYPCWNLLTERGMIIALNGGAPIRNRPCAPKLIGTHVLGADSRRGERLSTLRSTHPRCRKRRQLSAVGFPAVADAGNLDGVLILVIEEHPVIATAEPEPRSADA
jgi:hypothetical protein